ncbi:homeobox domain containing protein [Acanthamoeba castellanii str. Neff]|uniref:Homeobox domain containing protein n=1 Tax=Acanthamoeba castellanii (strain ATCC 30010 / Neff) TaxID=1257118 RepID=L8H4T2_ACACF|nr:homeobox domain containing protein [Acanthamoeba castellanii str. Neff]ELR20227.1 homeobox domain containing protein [Acanthamoeba castellanii str. Neff]
MTLPNRSGYVVAGGGRPPTQQHQQSAAAVHHQQQQQLSAAHQQQLRQQQQQHHQQMMMPSLPPVGAYTAGRTSSGILEHPSSSPSSSPASFQLPGGGMLPGGLPLHLQQQQHQIPSLHHLQQQQPPHLMYPDDLRYGLHPSSGLHHLPFSAPPLSASSMQQQQQPSSSSTTSSSSVMPPMSATITIAPSLSPSVIDASIEQLFPLSGKASTSTKETHGSILDTELAGIINNVEMIESSGAGSNMEETKVKLETNPLHPMMLVQSILHLASIVASPPSPASPSTSSPLGTPRSSGTGTGLSDWSLDGFCKSQGINLSSTPKTSKGEEFIHKVKKLQEAYEVELGQLNLVADQYASHVMSLLKAQAATRPITDKEQSMKLAVLQERFDYLRTQLRQSVCNAIVLLQKHYNQVKKKRRSLNKKATEVLNTWFFNHLNDPYPSDEEKMMLASHCGLTLNQVNNWFGNKRIRYKRKCLEEEAKRGKAIQQHMEELGQPQEGSGGGSGSEGALQSSQHYAQYEPMAAGPAGVELDSGTTQYYI